MDKIALNSNSQKEIDNFNKICDLIDSRFSLVKATAISSDIDLRSVYPCGTNHEICSSIKKLFDNNKIFLEIEKIQNLLSELDIQKILLGKSKKQKLIPIQVEYDPSYFSSIEEELENLGDFAEILREYHRNFSQFQKYIFQMNTLNKNFEIFKRELSLKIFHHSHISQKFVSQIKNKENIFIPKLKIYFIGIDGECIDLDIRSNEINEKLSIAAATKMNFGLVYEIKETNTFNEIYNTEDGIELCVYATPNERKILGQNEKNFLVNYYSQILFCDFLYEKKEMTNLLFVLSVLKNAFDNEIIACQGYNENIFINEKINDIFIEEIEKTYNYSLSQILICFTEIANSYLHFLLNFQTRHSIFKFTFDQKRSYANFSLYKQKEMKKSGSSQNNVYLKFLQNLSTQKIRHKITGERGKEIETLHEIYFEPQDSPINYAEYLEFDFNEEIGKGLGPTNEFYYNLFSSFQKKEGLFMTTSKNFVYPLPLINDEILKYFELIGFAVARAIFDDRVIDFPLSGVFFDVLFNKYIPFHKIQEINQELYKILSMLQRKEIEDEKIESLSLSFVIPGYEKVQLIDQGKIKAVNSDNVYEYANWIYNTLFISPEINSISLSFKKGFDSVFPISKLALFSSSEIEQILTSTYTQWSEEMLFSTLVPDHGYTKDSKPFLFLVKYLSELDKSSQQKFLKFSTGCTRLPLGGFSSLSPPLTVVKRVLSNYKENDDNFYLPSVMTCQNYLKLPNYSSFEILKEKMNIAINEGGSEFHLS